MVMVKDIRWWRVFLVISLGYGIFAYAIGNNTQMMFEMMFGFSAAIIFALASISENVYERLDEIKMMIKDKRRRR